MKIGGFQKFSLLDYPGQLAAIVFAQGCNFRCPYCHNPQLVDPQRFGTLIREADIFDFLLTRKGKLGAICITGGEPCMQPELIDFVRKLKEMDYLVKIDTNGSFPNLIENLIKADLVDYWAMDVKAPENLYSVISGNEIDTKDIQRSMDLLRGCGKDFEFRTTLFERLFNLHDLSMIQQMLKPGDRYYLQQCRYESNLEELSPEDKFQVQLGEETYLNLLEHPACKHLMRWGDLHNVNINIRSL
ncbi:MAG: anaerobic ribonucleoside-triphosphate reductase activating protein [Candidatus Cloacimonadaceae bacterium]|nr:anaerobic ribonucleoside-triphosphate reductase activating protein [Candidatus Cloacimonadaceae bacterium]MDP3114299.1 anaerobic ribonucleoside-triphosphate reductase activating protein [Candidatus Cloacimonadaceae bacterium]